MGAFYDDITDLPELEGWCTVPQIAQRFGVARQRGNQWVQEGKFPNVARIGEIIVIPDCDVEFFAASREGRVKRGQERLNVEDSYTPR